MGREAALWGMWSSNGSIMLDMMVKSVLEESNRSKSDQIKWQNKSEHEYKIKKNNKVNKKLYIYCFYIFFVISLFF